MFTRTLLITSLFFSHAVFSIEPSEKMNFGRFTLEPRLSVNVQQDDNLLKDDENEIDVTLTEYVPSLGAIYDGVLFDADVNYQFFSGTYDDSSQDDYDDHRLNAEFAYQLTRRNKVDLYGYVFREHENRSTGDLDFDPNSVPNEYDENQIGLKYTFGRAKAKGRVELFAESLDREYTNNENDTADEDREETLFGGAFFLRVSPRTSLFVEYTNEDSNYLNDPDPSDITVPLGTLDSTTDQYSAGFKWQLAAKTTGQIKLGYISRKFDSSAREDFSGFSWDIRGDWNATSQSLIRFTTSRADKDSDDGANGGYIDQQYYSVDWEKKWGNKFTSTLSASLTEKEYIDYETTANAGRDDSLLSYGLRFDYAVFRWLDIGLSAIYDDNDSSDDDFDYDRERITLHLVSGF